MNDIIRYQEMPAIALASEPAPFQWLPLMFGFLRRRWRTIILTFALMLVLGIAYDLLATPKFTATTSLLVDRQRADLFHQRETGTDAQYENAVLDSQVEIVQSEGIARRVVARLKLARDAEFMGWGHGLLSSAISRISGLLDGKGPPPTPVQVEGIAANILMKMTAVRRLGTSYVIEISVRTPDRARSAQLANAIAAEYINEGLEAKSETTRHASAWLQDRLHELREQSLSADSAVQALKQRYGVVDTEKGTMNEHELADLSTQLVGAHARTEDAAAQLQRIQEIKKNGFNGALVSAALQSTLITQLRQDYLETSRRAAELGAKYGTRHRVVIDLRNKMSALQGSINAELDRILKADRSDYEVARNNEAGMQKRLDDLVKTASATNNDRVRVRSEESLAGTYRGLYGTFLQRYTQAAQDQSFPISESRVVTRAEPPLKKSHPSTPLVLAASSVLGLGLGFMLAFVQETVDRRLRTPAQVRAVTGLDCITLLPQLGRRDFGGGRHRGRSPELRTATRTLSIEPSILRVAVQDPLSDYAEAMRSIWLRAVQKHGRAGRANVIGCVSVTPGEGKSTVSANLAQLLASAGHRTLLVDWDFRKPSLSQAMVPRSSAGFVEAVQGNVQFEDLVWRDPQTGSWFLPASSKATVANPVELLNSDRTRVFLDALRASYEYVVLDLPPLGPVADALAVAPLVDSFVMIIDWARTSQDSVVETLTRSRLPAERILGVVLNNADLRTVRLYSGGYSYYERPA